MIRVITRLTIRAKFLLLVLITISAVVASSILGLERTRDHLGQSGDAAMAQWVETLHRVLSAQHALNQGGALPETKAREQALALIRGLSQGQTRGVWVIDSQPALLVNTGPGPREGAADAEGVQRKRPIINTCFSPRA
ncbi:MAG: hypothetical protein G8D28_09530 [gamma proteobacterium symbiont of Phacoides pectinatus]